MRPKLAPHRDSFETIPLTPLSNDQSANPARTPYQDYEMKYPSPILTGVPSNRKLPPTPFAGEAGFSSRSTARSVYPHQNWAKDESEMAARFIYKKDDEGYATSMGSEGSKRGRMLLGSDLDDMASPVGPSAGEFALDENPESLNGISGTRSILDKRPSFRNSTDGATVMLDFDTYETPVDPQYMSDFNNKYVLGHGSRVTNGYFGTGGRDGATGGQRGLETTQPVVDYGNATLRSVFTEETRPTRPKLQAQPFRTFTSTPVDVASAVAEPYRPPPIRKGDIIPPNPFRPRSGVFRHPSDGSYRSYSPGLREGARIHYATEQNHTPSPYRETQKVELLTLPKPPHHNADRRSIFSFLSYRAPRSTNRNTRVNSWGTGVWGGGNLEAAPIDEVVDKRSHLSRFIQNNAFTLWCVALVGTLVLVAVITWLVSVKLRRVDYSGKLAEMVQANAPVMAQSYGGEV